MTGKAPAGVGVDLSLQGIDVPLVRVQGRMAVLLYLALVPVAVAAVSQPHPPPVPPGGPVNLVLMLADAPCQIRLLLRQCLDPLGGVMQLLYSLLAGASLPIQLRQQYFSGIAVSLHQTVQGIVVELFGNALERLTPPGDAVGCREWSY